MGRGNYQLVEVHMSCFALFHLIRGITNTTGRQPQTASIEIVYTSVKNYRENITELVNGLKESCITKL